MPELCDYSIGPVPSPSLLDTRRLVSDVDVLRQLEKALKVQIVILRKMDILISLLCMDTVDNDKSELNRACRVLKNHFED